MQTNGNEIHCRECEMKDGVSDGWEKVGKMQTNGDEIHCRECGVKDGVSDGWDKVGKMLTNGKTTKVGRANLAEIHRRECEVMGRRYWWVGDGKEGWRMKKK